MQNIALFDENGQATAYGTSGGVRIGDFTVANARSAFNKSKKTARESITPIITAVNESINNIIKTLADNKEYLIAEAIVNAYYAGQKIVPADFNIPVDTSIGQNLISASGNKLVTTVQTLQQELGKLAALKGSTLNAKDYRASYSEIVGSIRASLNSIGGTMHEVGFTLAALEAAKKGEKALVEANKEIAQGVAAAGGSFKAN